jgi:AcrR family transcriptional regulator
VGTAARSGARARGPALAPRISSRTGLPREQVLEIQRARLLAGALAAVEEQGYAAVMVSHITAAAGVSRRTFYELFENREACLEALIEDIVGMVQAELANADLDTLTWRERMWGGLRVILSFFDREPALARVSVVQALHGGPQVQARREQVFARLAAVIDEGCSGGSRAADCTPLTAEGLVGAAFGILYARLAREAREPLTDLQGELMGMIVLPYQGPAAARAERARKAPRLPTPTRPHGPSAFALADSDPLRSLPMRVTYRTARVLECIADEPGVSNREVADSSGIKDPGQISKLLARLERLGLLENTGEGAHAKGEPNAWLLTPLGQQVSQRLRVNPGYQGRAE